MLVRIFAEMVLWILNLRFPPSMFNGMALKDLSATCKAKLLIFANLLLKRVKLIKNFIINKLIYNILI